MAQANGFYHLKYWFDNQNEPAGIIRNVNNKSYADLSEWLNGLDVNAEADIDVTGLGEGVHALHFALFRENGDDGYEEESPRTAYFVVNATPEDVSAMRLSCSIDGSKPTTLANSLTDGYTLFDLDVNEMQPGLHTLTYQVTGSKTLNTPPVTTYFLIDPTMTDLATLRLSCSIDSVEHSTLTKSFTNGKLEYDLNVSEMQPGLHTLTYFVKSQGGLSTPATSNFFLIDKKLASCQYWLNHDTTTSVLLTGLYAALPYDFEERLSVATQPISSKSFAFAVEDAVPVCYAVNDITIRVTDVAGAYDETEAAYIDTKSRKPITSVTALGKNIPCTTMAPTGNHINWYMFYASEGDEFTLTANRPCTLHVYAPDGEEIFTANDEDVKQQTALTGTLGGYYYAAVHDITDDFSAETLTMVYMNNNTDEDGILPVEGQALFNVYSTSGVEVRHQTSTLEGLPAGIYVVRGKKFVVR